MEKKVSRLSQKSLELSVLVPSIRPNNLKRLYDSTVAAFSHPFEFIVIGPYGLPSELENMDNVKWIKSFRSPLAAQQQGLCESIGRLVTYAADDGLWLPGALDIAYNLLENKDYRAVITGKYQEGERVDDNMEKDDYYILNNHVQSSGFFIPENTWMLNCGMISRKILLELGGWDSYNFIACPIGYNDLAIRLQKYGCKFILQQEKMFECVHLPGLQGDHGPIHIAQTEFDEPKFKELYSSDRQRIAILLENWKGSPERFSLRFGD